MSAQKLLVRFPPSRQIAIESQKNNFPTGTKLRQNRHMHAESKQNNFREAFKIIALMLLIKQKFSGRLTVILLNVIVIKVRVYFIICGKKNYIAEILHRDSIKNVHHVNKIHHGFK